MDITMISKFQPTVISWVWVYLISMRNGSVLCSGRLLMHPFHYTLNKVCITRLIVEKPYHWPFWIGPYGKTLDPAYGLCIISHLKLRECRKSWYHSLTHSEVHLAAVQAAGVCREAAVFVSIYLIVTFGTVVSAEYSSVTLWISRVPSRRDGRPLGIVQHHTMTSSMAKRVCLINRARGERHR